VKDIPKLVATTPVAQKRNAALEIYARHLLSRSHSTRGITWGELFKLGQELRTHPSSYIS